MDKSLFIWVIISQTVVFLLGFCFLYLKLQKANKEDIKVVLLEEISSIDGFLKKSYKIRVKQQIYFKNIPIGEPVLVVEHVVEEVNKEQVERILKEYVAPFLALGKHVMEIKSGSFFSRFVK